MESKINYDKVLSQADDIRNLSKDLNQEILNLENLLSQIRNEWCGPASEEFQKQLLMLIADMKTTKYNMTTVSSTIENTAMKIQTEDANSSNN